MIYDNIDWHVSAQDYPPEVPRENGATHIGMFLAWAILNELVSEKYSADHGELLQKVRAKDMTGREFLLAACQGAISAEAFSEEGNRFAAHYYGSNKYLNDYAGLLGRHSPTIYHARDSWQLYAQLKPVIDRRYADWKAGKKWWEFWK